MVRARQGRRRLVVGIENKIDSPESEAQLDKYCEGLRTLHAKDQLVVALLAPEPRDVQEPPACPYTTLTYGAIVPLLQRAIGESAAPSPDPQTVAGQTLARHYLAVLRNHIMPESNPEIDAICRELYSQHRQAWQAIRRRLPSERDEFHQQLGEAVCARLNEAYGGEWTHVVRRDMFVRIFRAEWASFGTRVEEPLVGMQETSEQRSYAAVHFRLVAGAGDGDGAQQFTYALRLKGPDPRRSPEARAVADSLRKLIRKVPSDTQYTVVLKGTKRLPPLREGRPVADDVLNWYERHMRPLVAAIDKVLPPASPSKRV